VLFPTDLIKENSTEDPEDRQAFASFGSKQNHPPEETIPEYKLILQNMFNLIQMSKTLYPSLPNV